MILLLREHDPVYIFCIKTKFFHIYIHICKIKIRLIKITLKIDIIYVYLQRHGMLTQMFLSYHVLYQLEHNYRFP